MLGRFNQGEGGAMMKKVITYGTFDMFHEGHYNILKRAKEFGDYLIVAVTGEDYDIGRGKLSVRDSLATRIDNVKKSGFADQVIVEEYLGQKIYDIIKYGVDVFVIGDDWKGKFDLIGEYCELIYLPRTKGISSTQIREKTFAKYRIGIVADRLDDNNLVMEASRVSGFAVTSVFSENPDTAAGFQIKYKLDGAYSNWDRFIADIDIVFVKTELVDRYKYVKMALSAGRHVITEDPCCIEKVKEEELMDIAKAKDVILMHNIKVLHTRVFIQLLWMVKSGLIGDVIRIDCAASKRDIGIKQLFYDLTTCALATVFNIMGTEYTGIDKKIIKENDSIEYMSMNVKYPGTEVIINIGNRIRMMNKIEIVGTKGTIWLGDNWWRADRFELTTNDGEKKVFNINYDGNGFKFIIKDLQTMIEDGRREYRLMNSEIDLAVVKVLEGIRENS